MQEFNYSDIQKIDKSATKKLLKYISKEIKEESILDKLDFFYPDFGEQGHTLAFNVWVSIDFISKDGKTFIEKFIEENTSVLSYSEKQVLCERNKANISLFQVLSIEGDYIKLSDLLQNKLYTVWDQELSKSMSIGDYTLARVANLLGHFVFIGDISFLPPSTKEMFLEKVIVDFNRLRLSTKSLTIKQYLKKHSINIYKIYTNCMFEAMEKEEDNISMFYDELDEFESYLSLKTPSTLIKKYSANLIDLYEYYLADDDLTLYDIDKMDLKNFFKDAISQGFIISQNDLNLYIATLKNYIGYLNNKFDHYQEAYQEIFNISQDRFELMNILKSTELPFSIDKELSNVVATFLNQDSLELIIDFDKFLLYIIDEDLELTNKTQHIKRKDLLEINSLFEVPYFIDKSSPNQKDFPLINLFYDFALNINVIAIEDNHLSVTDKGENYLRLKDEDKYSLLFQYILGNEFIGKTNKIVDMKLIDEYKSNILHMLSKMEENKNYNLEEVLSNLSKDLFSSYDYFQYLKFLGIIDYKLYPSYMLNITLLGKLILNFLVSATDKKYQSTVISLDNFRKNKSK